MKLCSICILMMTLGNNIYAQKGLRLINEHIKDCNKRDINQTYINTKTGKVQSLDSSFFEDGFIIQNGDTIKCKIYLSKHKISSDCYLYAIAKLSTDSVYVFSPKDISGYDVRGIVMKAHRSVSAGDTSYFFIKIIETGNVTLYDRVGVPSDEEYIYYFEKQGAANFLFLAPNKETDVYRQESYNKTSPMISKYSGPSESQFLSALSEYLKDCEGIHNKILAKVYTINDVETIIKEYNNCKK